MSLDPHSSDASQAGPVFFDRQELGLVLRVYGRMVAAGEWRDYAMIGHKEVAEFAVFRRSGDAPLYRIEKRPALLTLRQIIRRHTWRRAKAGTCPPETS